MSSFHRLDQAFENVPVLPLTPQSRYVLFSDCHRGVGTSGDNFLKNQHLYFAALQYYYDYGFTYIELGDGDELWENHSIEPIKLTHNNSFWMLSRFYCDNRLFMLYGNHDMVKRDADFASCHCDTYPCSNCTIEELFPGICFHSGLILRNYSHGRDIYLTHGHQADFFNFTLWRVARFLVRYLWRPLENIGFLDPTSSAKNNTKKERIEQTLTEWALTRNHILITGHTHRPMMGSEKSPYYNTGSCVHPRCITCIEIENGLITLVKWAISVHKDLSVFVERSALAEPENLF